MVPAAVVLDRGAGADGARDHHGRQAELQRRGAAGPDDRRPSAAERRRSRFARPVATRQGAQQRQRDQRAEARADRRAPARDRLPRRTGADPEGDADLLVAHPLQLAHQEGGALLLGQRPQAGDQRRDLLARLRLGRRRATAADQVLGQLRRRGRAVAEVVQRRVADDPVEPRAQLDLGVAAAQGDQRLAEGVLGDVLVAPTDDRGGEAVERPPVAADDLLESVLVAFAHQPGQTAIRLDPQGPAEDEAGHQCAGFGAGTKTACQTPTSFRPSPFTWPGFLSEPKV